VPSKLPWLLLCAGVMLYSCTNSESPRAINGAWIANQLWFGDSVRCTVTAETLGVNQVGALLSGRMSKGTDFCDDLGLPLPTIPDGPISNGLVDGDSIQFNLTSQFTYSGHLTGSTFSGTIVGNAMLGPPANRLVPVIGIWTADRQ
jgi:hypothetical protein